MGQSQVAGSSCSSPIFVQGQRLASVRLPTRVSIRAVASDSSVIVWHEQTGRGQPGREDGGRHRVRVCDLKGLRATATIARSVCD